jgi:pimeloyl-ACP methyl ester carboxylesterase
MASTDPAVQDSSPEQYPADHDRADHLVWQRTVVDGRVALYGTAGEGLPVLFLHGWALGQHTYKRALKRLVHLGCQVFAPALPGFGGTADLPARQMSFVGYAAWVAKFLDAVGIDEPVFAVGHSFGGGVAIKLSHDYPGRVRYLVLVNSVGGSTWSSDSKRIRSMAERPLWDWGIHFSEDIFPLRQISRVLPVILEDAVPNIIRNPLGLWKAGNLARRADLTAELEELKRRNLPVVVLWGDKDSVIPRASFDALCTAIGSQGEVVPGRHSWLLADPDAFGEVMTNSVAVAKLARQLEEERATADAEGLGRRLTRRITRTLGLEPADQTGDVDGSAAGGSSDPGREAGTADTEVTPASGDAGRV